MGMTTKSCSKETCLMQNPQPLENFHKNKNAKDGRSSICKNCKNLSEAEYRKTHKKEIAARGKTQRDKNPDYMKNWIQNNKEKHAKIQKKSKDKNREKIRKDGLEYYYNNREHQLALAKKRRDENPEKEQARGRKFRQENKGSVNNRCARRRSKKAKATPIWSTKEDSLEIKTFYIEAARLTKETGIRYDVDHILPINGKTISGLHVHWNLQILPRNLNVRKGNRILKKGSDLYNECEKFKKFPLTYNKNKNRPSN